MHCTAKTEVTGRSSLCQPLQQLLEDLHRGQRPSQTPTSLMIAALAARNHSKRRVVGDGTRMAQHVRDWRFHDSGDMGMMSTTLSHLLLVSPICDRETRSGNLRRRREGRLPWRDNSSDRQHDNRDEGQGLPESTRRES